MAARKELQTQENAAVPAPRTAERRKLVFKPFVDIFENDAEITLVADMPGVAAEDMTIELQDGLLTIAGPVRPWENAEEADILIEFEIGRYMRRFALPEAVDHDRIAAQFADGALRLTLPKLEKAKPRHINIKTG